MLNATKVESLIRKGQSVFIGDDTGSRNVGRLYLRVRPRKKGTTAEWIVQWFSVGQKRRMKLDNADPEGRKGLTLHGARERFSEISSMIRKGFNPKEETDRQAAEERDRREAEEQRRIVDEKANLTFGELMENRYIPWAKSSKKHWIDDENRYNNHLKPLLKDHRLGEIDVSLLYDVRDHLYQKGLAPATVKHCLVIIRQAYNKFSLWGLWHGANPVRANAGLIPRLNNSRLRTLTDEEERKLLSALWEKSPAVHDMAVISLYGGLRFGEIASLRWEDISFVNRRIYIHAAIHGY